MRGVNLLIATMSAHRRAGPLSLRVPARVTAVPIPTMPAAFKEPSALELVDLLAERRFGVEYQPILGASDLRIHGWEALARFRSKHGGLIPPDHVFARLHDSPLTLLHAERELKRLQIEHAPRQGKLFLNLDPDSWAAGGAEAFLPLLDEVREHALVVEIIENMSRRDIALSAAMARDLERAGIAVALDDVGAEGALFSFSALTGAAYLKMDRFWLAGSPVERARKAPMAQGLIATAAQFGVAVVLEGVETHADLETARALGAQYVQGWLFRPDFVNFWL
jgi:EAL domain-containing protein (putative c-di-GMP-specific phosphodiesterase class I)